MVLAKNDGDAPKKPEHPSRKRKLVHQADELSAQKPRRLFEKHVSEDDVAETAATSVGSEPEPECQSRSAQPSQVKDDDDDLKLGQFSTTKETNPAPCTPPPRKTALVGPTGSAEHSESCGSDSKRKEIPDQQTMLDSVSEELLGCCPALHGSLV